MSDRAAATAAISTGLFMQDPFGYLISGLSRSDCRSQPPHRELDLPAWQLTPMLDLAHVGRLRVAIEELPHRGASPDNKKPGSHDGRRAFCFVQRSHHPNERERERE